MKKQIMYLSILLALSTPSAEAAKKVNDEYSLQQAIAEANANSGIHKIIFKKNANINITAPVIYSGHQALTLVGNGAKIDGSSAGSFVLDDNLTAVTKDGTLVFNTAGDITIRKLSVINSATRGIVINIPKEAQGNNITVTLNKVSVTNSALYGLHIDDNANEFDDGTTGSTIGIDLNIHRSKFTMNGTGAIDFDGIRVDERSEGDINAVITKTHIDSNGGDGIELDEAGSGDVAVLMAHVTINDNGFFNEEDLDDGFDIDESDNGDIDVMLYNVQSNNNMDGGLDFDESGNGDVNIKFLRVTTKNNTDENIKINEEDNGDIYAKLTKTTVTDGGDDGIQFTETGEGYIKAAFKKVTANKNEKYGIKMEQWFTEDEIEPIENSGILKARKITLNENGKGNEIKTNNIIIK